MQYGVPFYAQALFLFLSSLVFLIALSSPFLALAFVLIYIYTTRPTSHISSMGIHLWLLYFTYTNISNFNDSYISRHLKCFLWQPVWTISVYLYMTSLLLYLFFLLNEIQEDIQFVYYLSFRKLDNKDMAACSDILCSTKSSGNNWAVAISSGNADGKDFTQGHIHIMTVLLSERAECWLASTGQMKHIYYKYLFLLSTYIVFTLLHGLL